MTGDDPETNDGRPVVFGEVLFDRFPDGSAVLGGAPFNVAWHLGGFALDPLFVSRVGDDDAGREIVDRMAAWGMDTGAIQVDASHPTGFVRVTLDDGDPSYAIVENQAWDFIDADALADTPRDGRSILCHGTLAARGEPSRRALDVVRHRMRPNVLIDVNLRDPWWNRERTEVLLDGVKWVKLNEGELETILDRSLDDETALELGARSLIASHAVDLVVVTLGANGALAVTSDDATRVRPTDVEIVDTVGAGDAFTAVTLVGLTRGWSPARIVERAGRFAAEICRRRGATHVEPDLYRSCVERWHEEDG